MFHPTIPIHSLFIHFYYDFENLAHILYLVLDILFLQLLFIIPRRKEYTKLTIHGPSYNTHSFPFHSFLLWFWEPSTRFIPGSRYFVHTNTFYYTTPERIYQVNHPRTILQYPFQSFFIHFYYDFENQAHILYQVLAILFLQLLFIIPRRKEYTQLTIHGPSYNTLFSPFSFIFIMILRT